MLTLHGPWGGPGLNYRVAAQFGLHVTKAQLHADLRAAPACLAAHHPAVVISNDGRASIQLDVTAVDIWLALLEAMVSVKGVHHLRHVASWGLVGSSIRL